MFLLRCGIVFILSASIAVAQSNVRLSFIGRVATTGETRVLDSVRVIGVSHEYDTTLIGTQEIDIRSVTNVNILDQGAPGILELSSPFVNPFTEVASFYVSVGSAERITIEVISMLGEIVATSTSVLESGVHRMHLDGAALDAGLYILSVRDGKSVRTRKLLKVNAAAAGLPHIVYDALGSRPGMDRVIAHKTTMTANEYKCIGYAIGYDADSTNVTLLRDTTVIFTLRTSNTQPRILSFESERDHRAIGLPVTFKAIIYDSDGDIDLVTVDYYGDGSVVDTLRRPPDLRTYDTAMYVYQYGRKGEFTPHITTRDRQGHIVGQNLDHSILIQDGFITPMVQVLQRDSLERILVSSDTAGTLVFTHDAVARLGLVPGSVLVGDTGVGFMRKIVSLKSVGGTEQATTVQASLTDIFVEASIAFKDSLVQKNSALQSGESLLPGRTPTPLGSSFKHVFHDVVLLDGDNLPETRNDRLILSGALDISSTLDVRLQIDSGQVRSIRCIYETLEQATMTLHTGLDQPFVHTRYIVAQDTLAPIIVQLDTIPVVFTLKVSFVAEVDGMTTEGANISGTMHDTVTSGLRYENGSWTRVARQARTETYERPSFAGNDSLTVSLSARYDLSLYGVPMSTTIVTPYIELDADISRRPIANYGTGMHADATFSSGAISSGINGYDSSRIIDYHASMWNSGSAEMPVITSIHPDSVLSGDTIRVLGSRFGPARDSSTVVYKGYDPKAGSSYNMQAMNIATWSDTAIIALVPEGVHGAGTLSVVVDGRGSNRMHYDMRTLYRITGTIWSDSLDVSGVTITDGTQNIVSDAAGHYTLSKLSPGVRSLTASKPGYIFSPPYVTVTIVDTDHTVPDIYASDAFVRDYDGNVYNTVVLGNQIWMTENLRSVHLNDGTPILHVPDSATWWSNYYTGMAYCWYGNNAANKSRYGALYNYNTVHSGKLAPWGWHVPSDSEWHAMILSIDPGAKSDQQNESLSAGLVLKNPGYGTFNAILSGIRQAMGVDYHDLGQQGEWWSSTYSLQNYGAYTRALNNTGSSVFRLIRAPNDGISVRCVMDAVPAKRRKTYDVSGAITGLGVPVYGISVNMGEYTAVTDSSGRYRFTAVSEGSYLISPLLTGVQFIPNTISVNVAGSSPAPSDFSASAMPTVTDIDGNVYHTIRIGKQEWMLENLRTTHYNDGTTIHYGTSRNGPEYCWYGNDSTRYAETYGALYSWAVVNTGKLAPQGWHVPTSADINMLVSELGGANVAGSKMKEAGLSHWIFPNDLTANNSSGFTALPSGVTSNPFDGLGWFASWWTSDEMDLNNAITYCVQHDATRLVNSYFWKNFASAVRCVKD